MRLRTEDGEVLREGREYWVIMANIVSGSGQCAVQNPTIDGQRVRFQGVGLGAGGTCRISVEGVAIGVYSSKKAMDVALAYVAEMEWTIEAKESTNGKA